MSNLVSYFQTTDNGFWGDDVYRWWFYLSIILIIILDKKKMVKRVYAIYPIIFFIALFNPITYEVTKFFAGGMWQYYARLYSMLPVPYTLALGTILIIDSISFHTKKDQSDHFTKRQTWRSLIKLNLSMSFFALIIFGGTSVYSQDWMQPAQNLEKVPPALFELKEKFGNIRDRCIAVPESLSSYIRQVNASFYTPYGRYVNELGSMLSQENPDPMSVMREAGAEGCDFILVYDNETNEANFRNNGYEVYARINGYLAYEVDGVPVTRTIYDESRRAKRIIYFDSEGNPQINEQGYAGIEFEYDQYGNISKKSFLDRNLKRNKSFQGYASIYRTYTHYSRQIASEIFMDESDNPVLINGRFETRYTYDNKRRLEGEQYFDDKGNPMNRTDLSFASRQIIYGNDGDVIGEMFFDAFDEPVRSTLGYASYKKELNEAKKTIKEEYFDSDGKLLGMVSQNEMNIEGNIFRFFKCSSGVSIQKNGTIDMNTIIPHNKFNFLYFQLYDAKNGDYLTSFGSGDHEGTVSGNFINVYPDGLYSILLKGNSNCADERVSCLVYLKEGDMIKYSYTIQKIEDKKIMVKDVKVIVTNNNSTTVGDQL